MELFIAPRAGIWCRSLSGWDQFRGALSSGREPDERLPEPVPDLLPVREGRRAPPHVRLAIEAGTQACRENGVDPGEVMTVFASAMGDIQITDYMCRTLAGPAPMLSPTRFHNSVHNTASGYWSIGAENRHVSVAMASQAYTFPVAMLEAATLAACEGGTVLLIAHDIAASVPLDAVCANHQPFATAILLSAHQITGHWRPLGAEYRREQAPWPEAGGDWLQRLADENYCARSLPLLAALAGGGPFQITLPVGEFASLRLASGNPPGRR